MAEMADLETYPDKDTWLKARRTGLGSSDAPVILGLSPYKKPFELWAEKVGLAEVTREENEAMKWGLKLQPDIGEEYAEQTGRVVTPFPAYSLLRHPVESWLLASPDFWVDDVAKGRGLLEAKTASAWTKKEWQDEVPLAHQVQLAHQILVVSVLWGSVAALIGGQSFVWADLDRDQELLDLLFEKERAFHLLIERDIPPPPDASESAKEVLRKLYPREVTGKVIALPSDALAWHRQKREAEEAKRAADLLEREAENLLRAALGDAEAGMLPDGSGAYTNKFWTRKGYEVKPSEGRTLRFKAVKGEGE